MADRRQRMQFVVQGAETLNVGLFQRRLGADLGVIVVTVWFP